VLTSVLLAGAGRALLRHERVVEVVVGSLIIVLGAAFVGLIPGLQREWRIHRLPAAGLVGAPVFGAVFALSWSPCLGPTLGVVLGLATVGGSTGRAVTLALAYCLGLGLPFIAFGLGFRRLLGVFRAVRRNSVWVTRIGGALLIVVGIALVTGGWVDFVNWLRATVGVGEVSV
jgi:cytochrome c-type biogenesis protein